MEEKHDSEQTERWVKEGLGWGLHGAGTTREAPERKKNCREMREGEKKGRREKREREGGREEGRGEGREAQGSPCCRVCTQE